jgi:hypothetical protein
LLVISTDETPQPYTLARLTSDFGEAYRIAKIEIEYIEPDVPPQARESSVYDINLDMASGNHSCTCLGQLRWGHRHPCKHIAGLLVLKGRDLI